MRQRARVETMKGSIAAAALLIASLPCAAQSPAEFYRGRQIKIIVGTGAGQDYDLWARLIGRHMGRHMPGNPVFVAENMPGGGHLVATNWLYNIAPRDGTVLGVVSRNITDAATLKTPNVRFDPQKFNWIGSPEFTNRVFYAATATGVTSAREQIGRAHA